MAVLIIAAILVHPYDIPISDYLRQYNLYETPLGMILKPLGKYDFVFFAAFFVTWATGNRRFLYRFAWAAIPSGLFVLLLKFTIARPRPIGDHLSFPSGDSSIAFVWAAVLAGEYPALAVPSYLTASFLAFMRVAGAKHYPADILVGSAIGFAAGSLAVAFIWRRIPRGFYRLTRRLRWGALLSASFLLYVAGMIISFATHNKPVYQIFIITGGIILLSLLPVLIARVGAYRRLIRLCRRKVSLTQPSNSTSR